MSRGRHIDGFLKKVQVHMQWGPLAFCLYRNQSRYECLSTNALVGYKDDRGDVITSRKDEYFRDLAPYRQALTFTRSPDQISICLELSTIPYTVKIRKMAVTLHRRLQILLPLPTLRYIMVIHVGKIYIR